VGETLLVCSYSYSQRASDAMGLKSLLFGSKASTSSKLSAQHYNSTIAGAPPVKGSYPVAGNGPGLDVLKLQRESEVSRLSTAAPSPNIARNRDERPQTAPYDDGKANNSSRTFSGFSMKAPPSFYQSRRASIKTVVSRRDSYLPRAETPPPLPSSMTIDISQPPAEFQTNVNISRPASRKSRKEGLAGIHNSQGHGLGVIHSSSNMTPPLPSLHKPSSPIVSNHNRVESIGSHKPHVDLLDAHSAMHHSQKDSKQRAKAAGLRIYGEDVADRNIKDHGHGNPQLDLNAPDFSYLKSIYTPSSKSRLIDSALQQHDRRNGDAIGDDIRPQTLSDPKGTSLHSFTGYRPVIVPSRTGSAASNYSQPSLNDAPMTDEEPPFRYHKASPIPERGRTQSLVPVSAKSKPPVSWQNTHFQPTLPPRSSSRGALAVTGTSHEAPPLSHIHESLRKGATTYSAFPSVSRSNSRSATPLSYYTRPQKQESMVVESASKAPGLDKVANLKDNLDTNVNTQTLPGTLPHSPKFYELVASPSPDFTESFYLSPLNFTTPYNTNKPSSLHSKWPLSQSISSFDSGHAVNQI
jgi:hypothetical protein